MNISSDDTWEKGNFLSKRYYRLFDNDTADSFRIQLFLGVGSNFTSGTLPTCMGISNNCNFAAGQSIYR